MLVKLLKGSGAVKYPSALIGIRTLPAPSAERSIILARGSGTTGAWGWRGLCRACLREIRRLTHRTQAKQSRLQIASILAKMVR